MTVMVSGPQKDGRRGAGIRVQLDRNGTVENFTAAQPISEADAMKHRTDDSRKLGEVGRAEVHRVARSGGAEEGNGCAARSRSRRHLDGWSRRLKSRRARLALGLRRAGDVGPARRHARR
jgi:hypothetical protein